MMSGPLDRQVLEAMKRSDLQKLCKDHGIKANLKSEALVDLLLETSQPRVHNTVPAPAPYEPKRNSSMRIISYSGPGSRPRGRSGGSVIIHDTDEEEESEDDNREETSEHQAIPMQPPRTRKAKETQFRLGVGRPVIAGGSGARAVTKSQSVSRGKRGKGSRSMKPKEDVIQEEDEEQLEQSGPSAGPSGTSHELEPPPHPPESTMQVVTDISSLPQTLDGFSTYIMDIVRPLQQQIESLQADVRCQGGDVTQLKAQIGELKDEITVLRTKASLATELEAEVQRLKGSIAAISLGHDDHRMRSDTSEGKARALGTGASPTTATTLLPEAIIIANPQPAHFPSATSLGKRNRDSQDSDLTDAPDAGLQGGLDEKHLVAKVSRPSKKRPRLVSGFTVQDQPPTLAGSHDGADILEEDETVEPAHVPRGPAFKVFVGPEEPPDIELPSDPLSRPETTPTATASGSGPTTATAHANENAPPFTFTFQPITSTPAAPFGLPAYSYPEPPTSPTPGANPSGGYIERAGGRRERNDLYHPLGEPRRPRSAPKTRSRPPSRATQHHTAAAGSSLSTIPDVTINPPPTILRTPSPKLDSFPPPQAESTPLPTAGETRPNTPPVSSSAVGLGIGMTTIPETPAPAMPRTMYGTELEGDTRFGDFGVEGVAMGFWTGSVPRL